MQSIYLPNHSNLIHQKFPRASLKFNSIYLALFFSLGAWISQATSRTLQDAPLYERYEQWMAQYGRVYVNNYEKEKRFKIFQDNVVRIEAFNNANDKLHKLGINAFAGLTNEEFNAKQNRFKGHMCSNNAISLKYKNLIAVPATMDWRKKRGTPVKDQGQCGEFFKNSFDKLLEE
ncbi:hypothetical protein SLE2022_117650 [Rubroshorea leprosula]